MIVSNSQQRKTLISASVVPHQEVPIWKRLFSNIGSIKMRKFYFCVRNTHCRNLLGEKKVFNVSKIKMQKLNFACAVAYCGSLLGKDPSKLVKSKCKNFIPASVVPHRRLLSVKRSLLCFRSVASSRTLTKSRVSFCVCSHFLKA